MAFRTVSTYVVLCSRVFLAVLVSATVDANNVFCVIRQMAKEAILGAVRFCCRRVHGCHVSIYYEKRGCMLCQ